MHLDGAAIRLDRALASRPRFRARPLVRFQALLARVVHVRLPFELKAREQVITSRSLAFRSERPSPRLRATRLTCPSPRGSLLFLPSAAFPGGVAGFAAHIFERDFDVMAAGVRSDNLVAKVRDSCSCKAARSRKHRRNVETWPACKRLIVALPPHRAHGAFACFPGPTP